MSGFIKLLPIGGIMSTASESETTMNSVQIEQKSYEMPPRERIMEKSRRRIHHGTDTQVRRGAVLYPRS
jgi:hypothetical protein